MINILFSLIILVLVVAFVYMLHEMLKHTERQAEIFRQERQVLLDRIQAKDFTEYKIMTNPVKRTEPKPPQDPIIPL